MNRRRTNLPLWLGGAYLAWSLLVYFGTLGSDAHSWWPIFLYFIIWPISSLYEAADKYCLFHFFPDPAQVPSWIWTLNDYISGAFYVVVGTLWVWFLGRLISKVTARMRPVGNDAIVP
jgi:hypothetical protein